MKSILGGTVYSRVIDGWIVYWESQGDYRRWCLQEHPSNSAKLLVVMFNPSSISGDGANLRRDTTLRILREVCEGSGLNPFVLNLFDPAAPSPKAFFRNWNERDGNKLIYDHVAHLGLKAILFAYGSNENKVDQEKDISNRIQLVRTQFKNLP